MTGQADDRIHWISDDAHVPESFAGLCHRCPAAVVIAPTSREALDPMALGTCRYCGERLPVSPSQEPSSSDA